MPKLINDNLSNRQRIFCENYIQTRSAPEAARAAGYPENNAARVLKTAAVAKILDVCDRQAKEDLKLTYVWKAKKLMDIVENNPHDPRVQVVAIAELNKMQGHYAPTSTINVDVSSKEDLKKASDFYLEHLREY